MAEFRKKDFKKGLDQDDGRKKRADLSVQISKSKREDSLAKRRNINAAMLAEKPVDVEVEEVVGSAVEASPSRPVRNNANRVALAELPTYVYHCNSADEEQQLEGTKMIRRLLSRETDPPVREVLETGVVDRLISLLDAAHNPTLQFEAAWALTNVASTEYTSTVVDRGITPKLANLLLSPNADVREQSLWCLGNIAGDNTTYRDMVLTTEKCVENLLLNVQHPANVSLLRNVTWTLSNLCRGKPLADLTLTAPILPALVYLAGNDDQEVLADALWGLSYLSEGDDSRVAAVVETGVVARVVQLLGHNVDDVITPALRIIGNVVSGADTLTQSVLDAGGLVALTALLRHTRRTIRKEACWTASNIAAGNKLQLEALVTAPGLLQAVVQNLKSGEWAVKKEAAWVISNVTTSGTMDHIRYLADIGVIGPLCDLLTVSDTKVIAVVLDALHCILRMGRASGDEKYAYAVEECKGLDKIEELQDHANETIYRKSVFLIQTFFEVEEEEADAQAQQQVNEFGGLQFGLGAQADAGAVFNFAQPIVE